jgi:hypothetical protein
VKWRYGLAVALAACRVGGPSANPDDYVAVLDAAVDSGGTPMTLKSGDDSVPASDGDAGVALPSDDAAGDNEGGATPGDASCSSTVAVCDPVHNTGCNPFQQCDVNPLQASMPTGQCVLGGTQDAGACTVSIFNESCAPGSTCVDGGCRHLCFCNADCPVGECCSDPSGPHGFTLCGACR